jgi:nucleoside-diphosphate-sugar epimerase
MIIGNGMLASAMRSIDRDDVLFFCSGVSNSSETTQDAFLREQNLLIEQIHPDRKLIYFSSYFVNFENFLTREYYQHKIRLERLIASRFENFTIYRLPQVVGQSNNPATLTNFIYNKIISNETIPVFLNSKRNLLDIATVTKVIGYINAEKLFHNKTVNLVSTINYDTESIIDAIEIITDKKAKKKLTVNSENDFPVLLEAEMLRIFSTLGIVFDENYLERIIKTYYAYKYAS